MRLKLLSAMVVMAGLLVGCGDNGSGNKPAPSSGGSAETPAAPAAPSTPVVGTGGSKPQIGFVVRAGGWGTAVHAGAEKAVAEGRKGADGKPVIGVLWQEPAKAGDQVAAAKELIDKGVAAIVIAPEDDKALSGVVAAAGRVPVVAIDTEATAPGLKAVIAPDKTKTDDLKLPKDRMKVEGLHVEADDLAALKAGKVDALVVADPMEVGALAVKTATDCIKEKKVQSRIDVPWHVVTRENVDSAEMAPLVSPAGN